MLDIAWSQLSLELLLNKIASAPYMIDCDALSLLNVMAVISPKKMMLF